MGREQADTCPGEAELQMEKQSGAVGEREREPGIGFRAAMGQMAKRQERIQERTHEHAECQDHSPPRQTIDIRSVAFARPPKGSTPALPAERTPQRCGARSSVCEPTPVKTWFHGWYSLHMV